MVAVEGNLFEKNEKNVYIDKDIYRSEKYCTHTFWIEKISKLTIRLLLKGTSINTTETSESSLRVPS